MKSLQKFIQTNRNIKRHATRFSLVVVVFLFGLFMEAYMHDFNLVYITFFFVFSLAFTAGPIGVLNLKNLEAKFKKQGRIFAQKEAQILFDIKNTSSTTSWSIILHGAYDNSVILSHVKGESSKSVSLPFLTSKRGTFSYENCYLESQYPLSTARLTKPIDDIYHGIAYPEPKGKSLDTFLHEQETHYGEEKEFDGLREYDGSQKLSHIHWASVAKGEMSVKVFTKETRTHNLVFTYNNLTGDKESRLSQLCLWVLECEKRHLPFSIQMPHKQLNSNKESINEILEILARY